MLKKFNFDYDEEHDDLFIYDPKSKSESSINLDDIIIDFNNKKKISSVEILNASSFFKDLMAEGVAIDRKLFKNITCCKLEIAKKGSFFSIRFTLFFKTRKHITAPIYVPALTAKNPAVLMKA